jgi:hypothetical protein
VHKIDDRPLACKGMRLAPLPFRVLRARSHDVSYIRARCKSQPAISLLFEHSCIRDKASPSAPKRPKPQLGHSQRHGKAARVLQSRLSSKSSIFRYSNLFSPLCALTCHLQSMLASPPCALPCHLQSMLALTHNHSTTITASRTCAYLRRQGAECMCRLTHHHLTWLQSAW